LDARGSGSFSNIINALLWVAQHGRSKGIRVVNMSLGGEGGEDAADSSVCDAVKDVISAGISVVAAAGNAGGGYGPKTWTTQLPAACADVIVVTAVNSKQNPASFSYFLSGSETRSDRNKQRTVAAPGVDVKSTWARDLGMEYKSISGTSMAWWVCCFISWTLATWSCLSAACCCRLFAAAACRALHLRSPNRFNLLTHPTHPSTPPPSPHVAAVTAKCYAAGVCSSATQAVAAVSAAAIARNSGDEAYGFKGDPFFGRSRVGVDRYYGPMVHAGWR